MSIGCRLFGFRIVELQPPLALIDREQLRRRMIRSRLTPCRRLGLTDARRRPHATLLVHREAVDRRLAVPDHFVAPVRRRRHWRRIRGARRLRIANGQLHLARRVVRRIDDGQVIATLFERSVDGAVGVHGRIPLVARDVIVQIDLGICPVPHRDDDVPLPALRTRRSGRRQLSVGNPIGPVRVHRQRALAANLREAGTHPGARLAGLNPAIPRGSRVRGLTEDALWNLARGLVAHLMTASAAVRVDDLANPLALALDVWRNTVPGRPRAGEITLGRHLQQREPVQRGIVFGCSLLVRRHDRLQVQGLARCGFNLRRIHQPVAANPHIVVRLGKIRHQVAPLIVSDDDLDEFGWQVGGFGDHPDPRLGPLGAAHHAAHVGIANADSFALELARTHSGQRSGQEHGKYDHHSRIQSSFAHKSQTSFHCPNHDLICGHLKSFNFCCVCCKCSWSLRPMHANDTA